MGIYQVDAQIIAYTGTCRDQDLMSSQHNNKTLAEDTVVDLPRISTDVAMALFKFLFENEVCGVKRQKCK